MKCWRMPGTEEGLKTGSNLSEQRHEKWKRTKEMLIFKGPEAGACLECVRNGNKTSVDGLKWPSCADSQLFSRKLAPWSLELTAVYKVVYLLILPLDCLSYTI